MLTLDKNQPPAVRTWINTSCSEQPFVIQLRCIHFSMILMWGFLWRASWLRRWSSSAVFLDLVGGLLTPPPLTRFLGDIPEALKHVWNTRSTGAQKPALNMFGIPQVQYWTFEWWIEASWTLQTNQPSTADLPCPKTIHQTVSQHNSKNVEIPKILEHPATLLQLF